MTFPHVPADTDIYICEARDHAIILIRFNCFKSRASSKSLVGFSTLLYFFKGQRPRCGLVKETAFTTQMALVELHPSLSLESGDDTSTCSTCILSICILALLGHIRFEEQKCSGIRCYFQSVATREFMGAGYFFSFGRQAATWKSNSLCLRDEKFRLIISNYHVD